MIAVGRLLDFLGYATPLLYAAAAYGLFAWLDKEASDEAKAAVTSTMQSQGLKADRIASALLEIFDRIYTYPLRSMRAFRRSAILTVVASFVTFPIVLRLAGMVTASTPQDPRFNEYYMLVLGFLVLSLSVNILTDYISLFYVRSWFRTAGNRPVLALTLGALTAILIVTIGNLLRNIVDVAFFFSYFAINKIPLPKDGVLDHLPRFFAQTFIFSFPALIVFVWLPFLAIGILVARATRPLFWAVGKTQWFLKDGKNHPLKAVGLVAVVMVLGVGVILHNLT
jgi:hypothetical protein